MIGDRDVDHVGGRFMPLPDPEEGEPPPRTWKHRLVVPAVTATRSWLGRLRRFADFWFKELDKLVGGAIFLILFCLSLMPVAAMQTSLIWNETFSDLMNARVNVQETVSEIID